MAIPPELKPAFDKASRIILAELKQQAPVSKSGKNKGELKRSIVVKPVFVSTSNLGFEITGDQYGSYLDMGTGTYAAKKRGPFDKNPGPGKGGIKPRFWLTPSQGTKNRAATVIRLALIQYLKRTLKTW